ncbi:MAG: DUF2249 domain-containing protein [Actinobacteria bacterium]|nr:MAG: DUF2249 domain-containing protein [Actinomycetota bacterium]
MQEFVRGRIIYPYERFYACFSSGEELNRGCRQHIAHRAGVVRASSSGLVVDLRGLAPAIRRPVVFAIVDKMIEVDCQDSLVLICDHDPSGLGYQLDLRRESRGCYEFDCDQRMDGAWVALVRRRLV